MASDLTSFLSRCKNKTVSLYAIDARRKGITYYPGARIIPVIFKSSEKYM